jgi:hypothetical protein
LLLAHYGRSLGGNLSLMLRFDRILGYPNHRLLFLVASNKGHGQQQGHA